MKPGAQETVPGGLCSQAPCYSQGSPVPHPLQASLGLPGQRETCSTRVKETPSLKPSGGTTCPAGPRAQPCCSATQRHPPSPPQISGMGVLGRAAAASCSQLASPQPESLGLQDVPSVSYISRVGRKTPGDSEEHF